jgi:hypothetical protein
MLPLVACNTDAIGSGALASSGVGPYNPIPTGCSDTTAPTSRADQGIPSGRPDVAANIGGSRARFDDLTFAPWRDAALMRAKF